MGFCSPLPLSAEFLEAHQQHAEDLRRGLPNFPQEAEREHLDEGERPDGGEGADEKLLRGKLLLDGTEDFGIKIKSEFGVMPAL